MTSREAPSLSNVARDDRLDSTAELITRVKSGDSTARENLAARYLPLLQRWAHRRLPMNARGLVDTGDLVQVTLMRALGRLDTFEPRHEGAFLAYLRSTLMNLLRNETQRASRDPKDPIPEDFSCDRGSFLEEMLGREVVEAYERGLTLLPEKMREAVILRLEFGFSHREIAEAIGSPSANAARMTVSRALMKLSSAMDSHRAILEAP